MKRTWSFLLLGLLGLIVGSGYLARGPFVHASAGDVVPAAITPEPMPPGLTPVPLYAPLMGSTPPAVCVAADTGDITLSPFGTTQVEVEVATQNATQVEIAGILAAVDSQGIARVQFEAQLGETYAVLVNGRPFANCEIRFAETPSQWVGVHGDPYAWVGEHGWLDRDGLLYLFTAETTELVVSPELLTERAENNGRWTYILHYAGPGMELYSGLLRPGNGTFQHFFRSVLVTPEGRMLRIYNLGHIRSPDTLGDLTIDTGPGSSPIQWSENGRVELDDFIVDFRISATHNGIHQAALVTVPGDHSQWVFTRELNGGGAFISERIDGRIITSDLEQVGGAFGRKLRGENPSLDEWVVGVVDGDMPGPYFPPDVEAESDGAQANDNASDVEDAMPTLDDSGPDAPADDEAADESPA